MKFRQTATVPYKLDKDGNGCPQGRIVRSTPETSCHGVTNGLKQGNWRTRNNNKPIQVTRHG